MAGRALCPGPRGLDWIHSGAEAIRRTAAAAGSGGAKRTRARGHDQAMMSSLLPPAVDRQLQSLERVDESDGDPTAALRDTVEAISEIVERATSEPSLDSLHHGLPALLARRELVQRATWTLSAEARPRRAAGACRPPRVPLAAEGPPPPGLPA